MKKYPEVNVSVRGYLQTDSKMQRIFLGPVDQEDVSDRLRSHPSIEQLSVQKKNLLQICK